MVWFFKSKKTSAVERFYAAFGKTEKTDTMTGGKVDVAYEALGVPHNFETDFFYPFRPLKGGSPLNLFDTLKGSEDFDNLIYEFFYSFRSVAFTTKSILPIALGMSEGTHHVADIADFPSLLITGMPGMGKTTFIYQMVVGLLLTTHPEFCKIVLMDNYKNDLGVFENVASFFGKVKGEAQSTTACLDMLLAEMEKRQNLLYNLPVRDAGEANKLAYKEKNSDYLMPFVVVVSDEFFTDNKDIDKFAVLVQKGRACGFRFIMSLQSAVARDVTSKLKQNLVNRACFGVSDIISERVNLGISGQGAVSLPRGNYIFSDGGGYRQLSTVDVPYSLLIKAAYNIKDCTSYTWQLV